MLNWQTTFLQFCIDQILNTYPDKTTVEAW